MKYYFSSYHFLKLIILTHSDCNFNIYSDEIHLL